MIWLIIFLIIIVGVWLAFGRRAAGKTILITSLVGFIAFVFLVIIVIWTMVAPCSAPFADHSSVYCQGQNTSTDSQNFGSQSGQTTTPTPSLGTLPTTVGQCDSTTISQIGTRLEDGTTGNPIPGSGSAVWYADGGYQVSYDTIQGITDSQVGDHVNLCLVSIPTNCPPGDNRGRVYQATNLRTSESWEASDAEHSCGGA